MKIKLGELAKQAEQNSVHSDRLEGQSRRKNLIFHGIPETNKETWEQSEDKIKQIINEKLKIESVSFERVHRLNTKNKPRPIIAKFSSFKQRSEVFQSRKNLQNTNIYINEDFTRRVRDIRRNLRPVMKTHKEAGRNVTMVYDHLIVDGTRHDWDPIAKTCFTFGGRQRYTTNEHGQHRAMTTSTFDCNDDFMSSQPTSQSQQLWSQRPRHNNFTE